MSLSSLKGQNDLSAADWCCCRVTATPLPALLTQSHTCPGSPPGCHSSTVITKCCLAAVQSLHPHCNMPRIGISLANIANALRNGEKSGVLLLNYLSLFVSTQLHTLRIAGQLQKVCQKAAWITVSGDVSQKWLVEPRKLTSCLRNHQEVGLCFHNKQH